ncbi:hypothetical protein ACFQ5M_02275 [Agrilactobacillus yilanensis]|uniref:Uncharacterized protein n=1 Tax=Agrilactobacillus yilanensis TaxID=2485997 RepID=A0ABW4J3I4_9LACO|nr:hypothetical protein [Agrilactobacillus yilanensis]
MKLGFSNGQQFKAKVRNLAKEKQIDPQILMQEVSLDLVNIDLLLSSNFTRAQVDTMNSKNL